MRVCACQPVIRNHSIPAPAPLAGRAGTVILRLVTLVNTTGHYYLIIFVPVLLGITYKILKLLVVNYRGARPDCGAHSRRHGFHSSGWSDRLPGDGEEEEEGGGALQTSQARAHITKTPARQHAQDSSRGEAHLVGMTACSVQLIGLLGCLV